MKITKQQISSVLFNALLLSFSFAVYGQGTVKGGRLAIDAAKLKAGAEVSLGGEWLY